jgi:hypothetical protein
MSFIGDKLKIKGKVTAIVYSDYEKKIVKRRPITWWQKLFKLSASPMISINKNIVTDEGDALIADQLAETPAKTKVDNTNGHIEVGTGFTSESKSTLSCATPTGSPEVMDATYPSVKGAFGAANDNVTVYVTTFEAGDLNATGIDEAALINNSVAASAECLAYAQITPAVDVSTSDTLEVTWELTYTGS